MQRRPQKLVCGHYHAPASLTRGRPGVQCKGGGVGLGVGLGVHGKFVPTAIPSLDRPARPYVDYGMPAASRQECIASNVWMKDVEKRR